MLNIEKKKQNLKSKKKEEEEKTSIELRHASHNKINKTPSYHFRITIIQTQAQLKKRKKIVKHKLHQSGYKNSSLSKRS